MSLEMRWTKEDMVQVFKAIHGYDQVDPRLVLSAAKTDLGRPFFSQRVSRTCNELPRDLKRAQSVALFKKEISALLTNTIVP